MTQQRRVWPIEEAPLSEVEEKALEKCKQALEKCKQDISSYNKCVKWRNSLPFGSCSEQEQVKNDCLRRFYMETSDAVNQGKGPTKH